MRTDSSRDHLSSDPARRYLAPLREYEATALKIFPALDRRSLEDFSISPADALFVGYFLENGPRQVPALGIGTDMGATTLCFASHPKVSRVININANPPVAKELAARSELQPGDKALESLGDLKVLDVARAVIEEYPEEGKKVGFFDGEGLTEAIGNAELLEADSPEADSSEDHELVALVEGLRNREHISESLKTIFDRSPRAVVLLDCRLRGWLPSAQAGVADFMDQSEGGHRFRMTANLGPAFAGGNLGVLYPEAGSTEIEKILERVAHEFSLKLDPLRLLGREEELMNTMSSINHRLSLTVEEKERLEKQADGLQKRIPRLEARIEEQKSRNTALVSRYSRIRYRAANAAAESLLKLPGAKELLIKVVSLYRKGS